MDIRGGEPWYRRKVFEAEPQLGSRGAAFPWGRARALTSGGRGVLEAETPFLHDRKVWKWKGVGMKVPC